MSVADRYMHSLKFSRTQLYVSVIVAIGAFLRFFRIEDGYGDPDLRNDEPFTQDLATETIPEIIQITASDVHPPLYYFIVRGWTLVFGSSLPSLRALSAVFGIISIYLTFVVGRELFDDRVGLYGALFISLNWFHIFKAQDARMYTMLVVAALIALYGFALVLENPRDRLGIGLLILGNALAMYTHVYAVFFLAGQMLFVGFEFLVRDLSLRTVYSWVLAQVTVVVLYLPWIPALLSQTGTDDVANLTDPFGSLVLTYVARYTGTALIAIVVTAMILLAGIRYLTNPAHRRPVNLILALCVVSIVVPVFLSMFIPPIRYAVRYTLAAAPGFYLLAGYGLTSIDSVYVERGLVVLFILFSVERLGMYYEFWPQLIS